MSANLVQQTQTSKYDFPGLTFRNVLEIPVLTRALRILLLTNYRLKVIRATFDSCTFLFTNQSYFLTWIFHLLFHILITYTSQTHNPLVDQQLLHHCSCPDVVRYSIAAMRWIFACIGANIPLDIFHIHSNWMFCFIHGHGHESRSRVTISNRCVV